VNAVQHTHTTTASMRVMWLAVVLALFAALSYLLIQLSMLGVGDLQTAGGPAIALVAAGCYLVGGLLIQGPPPLVVDRRCCDQRTGHLVLRHGVSEPTLGHVLCGGTDHQDSAVAAGRMPALSDHDRLA
jgi:hypothetical protein